MLPQDLSDVAGDVSRELAASGEVLLLAGPIDVGRGILVEVRLIGRTVYREDIERIQDYLYILAEVLPPAPAPEAGNREGG